MRQADDTVQRRLLASIVPLAGTLWLLQDEGALRKTARRPLRDREVVAGSLKPALRMAPTHASQGADSGLFAAMDGPGHP